MTDRYGHLYATINTKLIESGERDQMKEFLRRRLVEHQWREQMKAYCKDIIKQKGLENATIDELVQEITPKGRALVPDSVKKEMLTRLRQYLSKTQDF